MLIKKTGAQNSQHVGFNVSTKPRSLVEDVARVETMKNHALLELHTFTSTRKFTDWIICYLEDMRSKIAHASNYQGQVRTKGGREQDARSPKSQKNQRQRQHQSRDGNDFMARKQGPQRGHDIRQSKVFMWGSENPCEGCGQANKHAYKDKPALSKEKCTLRSHPDWNGEDVPWEQSKRNP